MALTPYFTAVHHHSGGLTQKHGIIQCLPLYINSLIPRPRTTSANTEFEPLLNISHRILWMQSNLFNNPNCREPSINLCNFFLLVKYLQLSSDLCLSCFNILPSDLANNLVLVSNFCFSCKCLQIENKPPFNLDKQLIA